MVRTLRFMLSVRRVRPDRRDAQLAPGGPASPEPTLRSMPEAPCAPMANPSDPCSLASDPWSRLRSRPPIHASHARALAMFRSRVTDAYNGTVFAQCSISSQVGDSWWGGQSRRRF